MKKALSLAMAAAMTMGLAACGSTASSTAAADSTPAASTAESEETSAAESTDGKVYTVGICQLVQHDALDAATQGFKDALTEKLGEGNVKFDEQNASGDSNNCTTIVNGFVSDDVDLILANATAAAAGCRRRPPPTSPSSAPPLPTTPPRWTSTDWTGTVGGNISGTSDLAPLDQQAAMIQELFPERQERGPALLLRRAQLRVPGAMIIQGYLDGDGLYLHPLRLHRRQRPRRRDPDRLLMPPT